ncbi:TonB-dependent receptor domain-containing protein [Acidicapsa dinghuensis]|uniref:TonB-dependent receptor domain-containing protein n=1 Tax=Acidicapsa dinghuensis TaxID=2218256 RepID=A0ABW1ELZ7_9BACT|nr:TonB-dependent receptor [Acidicapsa dinghuensis]
MVSLRSRSRILPYLVFASFISFISINLTASAASSNRPADLATAPIAGSITAAATGAADGEAKSSAPVRGTVADPTGAIVPNAEINLVDSSGAVKATLHSDGEGNFQILAPLGDYTLVVSEAGFDTVKTIVKLAPQAAPMLHIVLPISTMATTVNVNAGNSVDLTATDANSDTSVLSATDLKSLPIFDNDYSTAMSAFLDAGTEGTGGAGLLVDGVEANSATVSASAVQEVRINEDPYSAQYYWPGRGQMEIITRSATDHYHGEFNFFFRDSVLNAQTALAASKPFEQRRVYEGHLTGPIPHSKSSGFLFSFNRAEEDLDSVVFATEAQTPDNPTGIFQANVPAPTRETDLSARASHQFGDKNSAYAQYTYHSWDAKNQGVGGQALASAGYENQYHENDAIFHIDSTLSPVLLNQLSIVAEQDRGQNQNADEAPQVSVAGDFVGGSAQNDSTSTEYNFRLNDTVTWINGHHTVKIGANVPHFSRRVFDDNTNNLGTYTFAPTLASDGVTVLASALQNYANNLPSAFTENSGQSHFVYHQQELGAFIQDQWKVSPVFSITPGVRYDWQNFLAQDRLSFSPRVSFAWVLNQNTKTVVRGGGGVYYDRFGGSPLLDLARYENGARRSVNVSLDPSTLPASGCVPILECTTVSDAPANLVRMQSGASVPYQIQYGLSIERGFGKSATGVISTYSVKGDHRFRSIDINAPTPESDYTERPDPDYGRIREMQAEGTFIGNGLDVSFRGTVNKYFTGFGRYTWSHFESNQEGIGWFPQNQYDPNAEWANSSWDRRNRLGMYAIFNRESVANLAVGVFANSGQPWSILTGADPYGDDLFNARPDGVARNTESLPSYVDLDLRWGHDWHLTNSKQDESPRVGFSAGAFNILNHENISGVDQVESSSSYGEPTTASPSRRIQLAMRFEF